MFHSNGCSFGSSLRTATTTTPFLCGWLADHLRNVSLHFLTSVSVWDALFSSQPVSSSLNARSMHTHTHVHTHARLQAFLFCRNFLCMVGFDYAATNSVWDFRLDWSVQQFVVVLFVALGRGVTLMSSTWHVDRYVSRRSAYVFGYFVCRFYFYPVNILRKTIWQKTPFSNINPNGS